MPGRFHPRSGGHGTLDMIRSGGTDGPGSGSVASEDKTTDPAQVWPAQRPRTAAEQRAQRAEHAEQGDERTQESSDPEVLATEIEKTREDLAETLDAIADKVSPKRVVKRTTKKVSDAAKVQASGAADTVKHKTASATEAIKDAAASVKDSVSASDEPAADSAVPPRAAEAALLGADAADAPAGQRPDPMFAPYAPRALPPTQSARVPMLVGAGAAVLVALLLLRRRRR